MKLNLTFCNIHDPIKAVSCVNGTAFNQNSVSTFISNSVKI